MVIAGNTIWNEMVNPNWILANVNAKSDILILCNAFDANGYPQGRLNHAHEYYQSAQGYYIEQV